MPEKISSIKHKSESRAHIPSKEEAGYEDASPKVLGGKPVLELPKNPVVHRGQDPELFWMNKYGTDDIDDLLKVDIRSLYRHEHIAPEKLIAGLHRVVEEKNPLDQMDLFSTNELFGNALEKDELQKVSEYYSHHDGWTNRLIQGDSHLVMASLLEREGMAGQVQTIYIDPPYGIKYNSNWQMKLNDRNVKDGSDEHLTGEPEMIKAFRDTWELGIHSYLTYLRDRLLIARELLTESGSCFVQISDENVHLVRCLMDEVFGSENFVSLINVLKTAGKGSRYLDPISDYLILYAKNSEVLKYRQIFQLKGFGSEKASEYKYVMFSDGDSRPLSKTEIEELTIPENGKLFRPSALTSQTGSNSTIFDFELAGKTYRPSSGGWKTNVEGLSNLAKKQRLIPRKTSLSYIRYLDDFPVTPVSNLWDDVRWGFDATEKSYVVQTNVRVLQRCILMTKSAGVKNGIKNEQALFIRIERLVSSTLHAEGFYQTSEGEKKACFHIGPKFGTVSKHAVNEAVKECRQRGDANWFIILGFSFESDITSSTQTTSMGTFEVTKARMHDDEAFDRLYGFISHPIQVKQGQKIAIRVISQFGEESMKVITVSD